MAIHAPTGDIDKASPNHKCESAVNRLVNEYPIMTASATGDNANASGFKRHAAKTNRPAETSVNTHTEPFVIRPAGIARDAVRGF